MDLPPGTFARQYRFERNRRIWEQKASIDFGYNFEDDSFDVNTILEKYQEYFAFPSDNFERTFQTLIANIIEQETTVKEKYMQLTRLPYKVIICIDNIPYSEVNGKPIVIFHPESYLDTAGYHELQVQGWSNSDHYRYIEKPLSDYFDSLIYDLNGLLIEHWKNCDVYINTLNWCNLIPGYSVSFKYQSLERYDTARHEWSPRMKVINIKKCECHQNIISIHSE